MGLSCQLQLKEPPTKVYTPGSTISGVIEYVLDKETTFSKITTSLKGKGTLVLKRKFRKKDNSRIRRSKEIFVDVDFYIPGGIKTVGAYEAPFNFMLPQGIPGSFDYFGIVPHYRVRCNITYYIRIKFEKDSIFGFTKRFKKMIQVASGITPRLPMAPTVYGERKTLFQLFPKKENVVEIKANVQNSVIAPGGTILFDYEVKNDTNVTIYGVEAKLVEIHKFNCRNRERENVADVEGTYSETGAVQVGCTLNKAENITVPMNRSSLENSVIVSRSYAVRIKAALPFPHRDAVLNIPVQVGHTGQIPMQVVTVPVYNDPPPTYWEAMGEYARNSREQRNGEQKNEEQKND